MSERNANAIRVLLVDDEHTTPMIMKHCLIKQGNYHIQICHNGKIAVETLRQENFDICFMDILMPIMSGVEATLIIRQEISSKMPIIAITASTMKSTRDACYDVGMNDFIVKPVNADELMDLINLYTTQNTANRTETIFNKAIFPNYTENIS
ncbi:MAG: response regulator [Candidatus Omnitrophota bacterium]